MRHGLRSLAIAAGAIAGASGGLVSRPHAFSASAPAAISRRASSVHASVAISKPPLPEVVERAPATHPAFELVRVEMVDEYTIKVATYRHRQSGAEVISAQADDENKVFGIAFRTPVEDSTGVPHILEHSVLCGSAKYTSKEPFTELLKGSLQTFLNAFTYPDRTCYPVASCNTKDFYNLVNVYLDAVLSPRAKRDPTVFAQEGWPYELDAAEEPLTYKGVVFNEMKGVYSSPDSLPYRAAQQATFPDNTYSVDSGGDPNAITTLSFKQFTDFHDAYYHPSNSRIFFYGDDPLEARLDLLDSYLAPFTAPATPAASRIETQAKFATPRRVVERFPASADEAAPGAPSHMVMLNWLLNEKPLSPVDELALTVLDELLMGTRTATLYKAMAESGLGAAVVGGGVSDELKQATFSVGLKGVAKEDVPKVEALALETLAAAAKDGFDADAVEAAVNTLEFQLREMNTGGFPKGLAFMLSMLPRWIYRDDEGANVADALRFEAPLAELKTKLASGEKVFEPLLASLLVDNGHLATIEMVPDASLAEEWAAKERSRLEAAKAAMGEEELADVIRSTADLKRAQLAEDSAEDLATIPRVGLADLEAKVKEVPTDVSALSGGVPLLTHPLPCAGVVYADALLAQAGTSELDATALQRRIGARTGGIDVGTKLEQPVGDSGAVGAPDGVVHKLVVRGKAVRDRLPDMLELVHSMLTDANLDAQPKAVELLKESKSRLEAAFLSSGNSFAGMRLSSRNTAVGYATELTSGVSYYEAIKEMLTTAQDDWPSLLARLERLRGTINVRDGLMINLTSDPDAIDGAKPQLDAFVGRMPAAPAADAHGEDASKWSRLPLAPREDEAYAIVSQVNYVAAGCRLFEPGEIADFGAASVASRALSLGYLWDNVRVAGGAYGGGCALNPTSGGFAFSSYRDPNLQATLDIYAAAADALSESDISAEALEQAIVGMVGDLDKPLTPDQKGQRALNWHLTGVTTAMRQEFRDQVLGCSPEAFRAFAERLRKAKLSVSVFGSEEALAAANAKRETPLPVKKIA